MDLGSIFQTAATAGGAITLGLAALNSIVLVKQGHKKIITSLGSSGRVVKEMTGNGLVLPWQGATEVETRAKVYNGGDSPLVVSTKDTNGVKLEIDIVASVFDANKFAFQNENPEQELTNAIYECIRDVVSTMDTDALYTGKDSMKEQVFNDEAVKKVLDRIGMQLENVIIADPVPPPEWIEAKNKIRRAEMDQIMATSEAEAMRIRMVGQATAEAQARALQGKGAADFKTAIIKGIGKEMGRIVKESQGQLSARDAKDIVLKLFELEVRESAANGPNNTFFFDGGNEKSNAADLIAALQAAYPESFGNTEKAPVAAPARPPEENIIVPPALEIGELG